jgi:CRISPR-associated protein Cmr5
MAEGIQTPEQRRAADALRAVQQLKQDPALRENYRRYVERLGPSILMNGLGQALATEKAAATNTPKERDQLAHHQLYLNLGHWLCREGGIYPAGRDVLESIVGHDQAHYLRAQAEALAWMVWHKKFCRAELPALEPGER